MSEVGEDAEAESLDASNRFVASGAVSQSAGNLGDLGDPAAIGFLLGFDSETSQE